MLCGLISLQKLWESDGLHHKRTKREKGKWGERYRKGEVNKKPIHYLEQTISDLIMTFLWIYSIPQEVDGQKISLLFSWACSLPPSEQTVMG